MKLSKEQIATLGAELDKPFGCCKLRCDGYEIDAVKKLISKTQIALVVYVNGEFKGEWTKGGEIAEKFHRESKRHVYKQKARHEAVERLKKRRLAAMEKEFWTGVRDKTVSMWLPYWGSGRAFLRHVQKTCAAIEVIKVGYAAP